MVSCIIWRKRGSFGDQRVCLDGSENIFMDDRFDKLQLMQYDLTDGTGKISTVEEQGFAGNIGIAGEKALFCRAE